MEQPVTALRDSVVFCQITGRDISAASCLQTQGQTGCFGCAAATRQCERCSENFVVVAATGTCSRCTAVEIELEATVEIPRAPREVTCQIERRTISGSMCRSIQGQPECRGCTAISRNCESCGHRPVRFAQYGMCFTCSVKEFGDDWSASTPDTSVAAPHLKLVSNIPETRSDDDAVIKSFVQEFRRIPLANIRDPEYAVRENYSEPDLQELGESMVDDGLIYPVVVEPVSENFYEVFIGSRRVRAARMRGAIDIPALVATKQNPLTKILMALIENIQRVNIDPFEEGRVYVRLMREFELTPAQVAIKTHRKSAHIRRMVQLLSLPDDVKAMVASGDLSASNAIELARLPEKERQIKMARASVTNRFDTPELRRKIANEIGEMEGSGRVISYQVTPEKFAARIDEFTHWIKRALPRLQGDGTSLSDTLAILSSLAALENQVGKVKDRVKLLQKNKKK